jgi:hypothetical protein
MVWSFLLFTEELGWAWVEGAILLYLIFHNHLPTDTFLILCKIEVLPNLASVSDKSKWIPQTYLDFSKNIDLS